MAKTKLKNVIDDTTIKMAKSKYLKTNTCFLEHSSIVSYIYVCATLILKIKLTLMFWKAITDGLSQMTHWEVWISILLYGILYSVYYFRLASTVLESANKDTVQSSGLIKTVLLGIALQGLLVTIMVSALLPILLGLDGFSPILFFQDNWWGIIKAGIFSIAITFLISFIPLVGNFITKLPGTAIFFQGAIAFHMLANPALKTFMHESNSSKSIYPGILVSIGFVLFSIIAVFVLGLLFSLIIKTILSKFNKLSNSSEQKGDWIIAHFSGIITGVLCLLIYCAYIRLTIVETIAT